jgi:hypothetical protein
VVTIHWTKVKKRRPQLGEEYRSYTPRAPESVHRTELGPGAYSASIRSSEIVSARIMQSDAAIAVQERLRFLAAIGTSPAVLIFRFRRVLDTAHLSQGPRAIRHCCPQWAASPSPLAPVIPAAGRFTATTSTTW